jgi:hypothetical protein
MRKRATAGDADGHCELRVVMGRSFGCKLGHARGIRRCARVKERGSVQKRAAWSPRGVGIDEISAAVLRAPMSYSDGLAA